jgi:hypothetical protein
MTTARERARLLPRHVIAWSLLHGLPGFALNRAARRGDLVAATAIDRTVRADPFATYDELRGRGALVDSGW